MQSDVILIHRSRLRLKTFKLQQTEMACIMASNTRLIVNHHSFGSYKTKQVISQLSPSMPHENNMIAKTITDFAFALIKAVPITITIACRSSNKKQYSSSGAKVAFYSPNISETAHIQKGNFPCWHGELKKFKAKISDRGLRNQIRSVITVD